MIDRLAEISEEIIRVGQSLVTTGLVAGSWGNVSARLPGTKWVAITPSGSNYMSLSQEDLVVVDLQGAKVSGGHPSSEMALHLAIYLERSDVQAIVHTHSVYASACAVARRPIPPIIEDLVQMAGGEVSVAAYALPGTHELAAAAVMGLGEKQAVLLANHGLVGCGSTLAEALLVCQLAEKAAQIFIFANQLGGAQLLSEEDVAIMHDIYLDEYRFRQKGEG
jgi:L-fuculose-phosphate aldolase